MLVTFFIVVSMFMASPALVPNSMQPDPIVYKGKSRPAVVPNIVIKGPAQPDTSRADSTRTE